MNKWRNKKTGTIYADIVFERGGLATVTTDAGSTYLVRQANLEKQTPTTTPQEDERVYPPGPTDEEYHKASLAMRAIKGENLYTEDDITKAKAEAVEEVLDELANKAEAVRIGDEVIKYVPLQVVQSKRTPTEKKQ